MLKKSATFFVLTLGTPAIAWACPHGLNQVAPMDFLMFGVAAAVTYRLALQPVLKLSEQLNSAIYLSCLIASFGAGVLATGELTVWPGFLGIIAFFLALIGAVYPKHWLFRLLFLTPVLGLALLGSFGILESYSNTNANYAFDEVNNEILHEVVF